MSSVDTVSNFIISIKNAYNAGHQTVNTPYSKQNEAIARVLKEEGYIKDYKIIEIRKNVKELRIYLKYGPNGEKVFSNVKRISKPGRRIYLGVKKLPRVCDGLGIAVISTNKGILSDRQARRENVGGEILFYIW